MTGLYGKFNFVDRPFVPDMTYNVFGGTLNLAQSINMEVKIAKWMNTF